MIVIDTCVLIWLSIEPTRLSTAASDRIAIERKNGSIAIAGITLYEIGWLHQNKRIAIGTTLSSVLAEIDARFIVLPISSAIAQIAAELPVPYPSDPMDRIIGASALDAGCPLITSDWLIRKSKALQVIW
jgi:PIN domain nuclease of toxin-antitoxin system